MAKLEKVFIQLLSKSKFQIHWVSKYFKKLQKENREAELLTNIKQLSYLKKENFVVQLLPLLAEESIEEDLYSLFVDAVELIGMPKKVVIKYIQKLQKENRDTELLNSIKHMVKQKIYLNKEAFIIQISLLLEKEDLYDDNFELCLFFMEEHSLEIIRFIKDRVKYWPNDIKSAFDSTILQNIKKIDVLKYGKILINEIGPIINLDIEPEVKYEIKRREMEIQLSLERERKQAAERQREPLIQAVREYECSMGKGTRVIRTSLTWYNFLGDPNVGTCPYYHGRGKIRL